MDGSSQAGNEFPYVPFAPDAYDDTAMIKTKFAQAKDVGENWIVPFTSEDANYVKRQRDQMENADFDRWVMQKFDLSDPAQLFLFQQIAPEQFERRMNLIDYQQNLVTKYARMRLMGPRNMDDLKFEWLVETGRVELPQGPIWSPRLWMANQYAAGLSGERKKLMTSSTHEGEALRGYSNRKRFMAGLFSPLKMLTQSQVGYQPDYENRGDIRGDFKNPTLGQLYEGSSVPNSYVNRYGENPIRDASMHDGYKRATRGAAYGGNKPNIQVGNLPADYFNGYRGYGKKPVTEAAEKPNESGGVGQALDELRDFMDENRIIF